jgi:ABC-type polysaccharide/polyol phosphate export permease
VLIFVLVALFTPVWSPPGASVLWAPLILFVQGVFIYGLVLFLATLQVFLRDTSQIVAMVTTVWMFLTPVFWVPELMGENLERYRGLLAANPAYHMVSAWRGALMGDVTYTTGIRTEHPVTMHPVSVAAIPDHLAIFALWAIGAYALGYTVFVFSQRRFADEV